MNYAAHGEFAYPASLHASLPPPESVLNAVATMVEVAIDIVLEPLVIEIPVPADIFAHAGATPTVEEEMRTWPSVPWDDENIPAADDCTTPRPKALIVNPVAIVTDAVRAIVTVFPGAPPGEDVAI